jgi:hypothetical protein
MYQQLNWIVAPWIILHNIGWWITTHVSTPLCSVIKYRFWLYYNTTHITRICVYSVTLRTYISPDARTAVTLESTEQFPRLIHVRKIIATINLISLLRNKKHRGVLVWTAIKIQRLVSGKHIISINCSAKLYQFSKNWHIVRQFVYIHTIPHKLIVLRYAIITTLRNVLA